MIATVKLLSVNIGIIATTMFVNMDPILRTTILILTVVFTALKVRNEWKRSKNNNFR